MMQTTDFAEIRLAAEAEAQACRMLLPAAFGPHDAPDRLFVAVGPDGAVVGAAAGSWRITRDAPGFPVLVTVVPPLRRRGLGRRLIDAVAADAAGETDALRTWMPLPPASDAVAFLRGCGFNEAFRFVTFEAYDEGAVIFDAALCHNLERMRARGRIPADVRVIPANLANTSEIALLAAREFPGITPARLSRMEAGDFGTLDLALSVVVLHGTRVAAACLCREADGILHVEMNIVYPEYRNGWANLMQVQAVTHGGLVRGIKVVRFSSDSRLRDTINVARRIAGRVVTESVVMTRSLTLRRCSTITASP